MGLPDRREWRGAQRAVLPLALAIVATGFAIKFTWIIHGIWDPFPAILLKELWPLSKSSLSPIRLISFFSMVVIVTALVPAGAGFLRSPVARPVILCGQQSLEIFCLGILLSALGHFVLSEFDSALGIQLLVNLAGILAMCLTASMINWYKTNSRGVAPQTVSAGSSRGNPVGK